MTRYFDVTGLLSFACMVAVGYLFMTVGPLP